MVSISLVTDEPMHQKLNRKYNPIFLRKKIAFLILSSVFLNSCRLSGDLADHQLSTPKTIVSAVNRKYQIPKVKSRNEVRLLVQAISNGARTTNSGHRVRSGKGLLGEIYVKSLIEVEGVPRSQGKEVISEVLSNSGQHCAGVGCEKVFDLREDQVDTFLDDLLVKTKAEPRLQLKDNLPVRDMLIGSLKDDQASASIRRSSQELVADLYLGKLVSWPNKPVPSIDSLGETEIKRLIGEESFQAIKGYTGINFDILRDVESYPDSELIKKGMRREQIDLWRQTSNQIDVALKKLPPHMDPVYRGINDVPVERIGNWIKSWESGTPIGLGREDHPALASASRDSEVAKHYVNPWANARFGSNYGVIMVLERHRGINIESISKIKEEKEVLIPRDVKFVINSIAPIEGETRVILLKMSGV
jgi:hypothetical protein